ncbi:hypothetical protein ACWERY_02420 [Streptomyces sp. NPDC004082]
MATTPRPIADLDVPLPTLRDRMAQLVARKKVDAAAERLRLILAEHPAGTPAPDGLCAEYRHLLYDADPDAAIPAFPYPTTETS